MVLCYEQQQQSAIRYWLDGLLLPAFVLVVLTTDVCGGGGGGGGGTVLGFDLLFNTLSNFLSNWLPILAYRCDVKCQWYARACMTKCKFGNVCAHTLKGCAVCVKSFGSGVISFDVVLEFPIFCFVSVCWRMMCLKAALRFACVVSVTWVCDWSLSYDCLMSLMRMAFHLFVTLVALFWGTQFYSYVSPAVIYSLSVS